MTNLLFTASTEARNIYICEFDAKKYADAINDSSRTLADAIEDITKITNVPNDSEEEHYFKVVIDRYNEIIEGIVKDKATLKKRLCKLLPLNYQKEFQSSSEIITKYNDFTTQTLERFMCNVKLDEDDLYKPYTSDNILGSGIVFWEISDKQSEKPIGILWFTFNQKITQIKQNDTDFGIMVRSKNILMGNNETFALQTSNHPEYITTYSELVAALKGVYGELLINSEKLEDNAARDWFVADERSYYIKSIIHLFMKYLHTYRYAASKYFKVANATNEEKEKLRTVYKDLTSTDFANKSFSNFIDSAKETTKKSQSESDDSYKLNYSEEDIPFLAISKKRFYNE